MEKIVDKKDDAKLFIVMLVIAMTYFVPNDVNTFVEHVNFFLISTLLKFGIGGVIVFNSAYF